jgi:fibronectin type 3 domain-containing protein
MRRTTLLLVALAAFGLLSDTGLAANQRQRVEQLAQDADQVVLGTVLSRTSRWTENEMIHTDVVVAPDVTLKGEHRSTLVVEIPGGTIGDVRVMVSDSPELGEGERVLLFLKRRASRFEVAGRDSGKFEAGSELAADAVERTLRHFETRAGRRLNFERGLATPYLARTRNAATTTSASVVGPDGCYITSGMRWSSNSTTYRIGPTIPGEWAPAIHASVAAWNDSGAAFTFRDDPASINEVALNDLVATYGSSYSNTYAMATVWYSVSTGIIARARIQMNSRFPWSTLGQARMADVQNIMTHEFGHWLHLSDVYSPSTCGAVTMWGSSPFGDTSKRSLEGPDIEGAIAIYGRSSSSLSAPVLSSPGNGATGVASSAILGWAAVTGATSYDVYFGASSNPPLVATTAALNYAATTSGAGVTYFWRVVAKNATSSSTSATWSFTTSATLAAPQLTSPVNGSTGLGATTALAWTAVNGATAYEVYFGTSSNPPLVATTSSVNYTVATPGAGQKYYWRVLAKGAASTASSATWSFTTALAAPTLTSPANGATGAGASTTLAWAAVTGATSYEVYFGTASNPPLITTTAALNYSVSTPGSGTKYYWRVVAKNASATAASATWSFTTTVTLPAPTLTSPANGATGAGASTMLAWAAVTGATSYEVYFGTASNPPLITTTAALNYSVSTPGSGTRYYWRVVAKNANASAASATWSFTTTVTLPAPTLTSPANGATGASASTTLAWAAVTGATSYEVYFGTASNPPLITTTAALNYTFATPGSGIRYYWRVVAKNANASATSTVWSFTTAITVTAPLLTSPANGAGGLGASTMLSWGAVNGATSYDIYFGTSTNPALAASTSGLSYTFATPGVNIRYYWRVVARNSTSSATSAIWSFTTAALTASQVQLISPVNGASLTRLYPTLSWSPVAGAVGYDVYLGTSSTPAYFASTANTSVPAGMLPRGTVHYWRVVARLSNGSSTSAVWWFRSY